MTDEAPNFSADELASLGGGDAGNAAQASDASSGQPKGDAGAQPQATEQKLASEAAKGQSKPTIVAGGDPQAEDEAKDAAKVAEKATQVDRNELTEDLRKAIAEHYAAGDKKAEAKELKRLERVKDIKSLWGMYRELEGKFTGGGLVKMPGKDAKPEDLAEFHKALGVPESPEEYFKTIKLDNGAVIGDADKPVADSFAAAVHKSGATPAVVNAAMNWYFQQQEQNAADLDEADETFRRDSIRSLKDEWGPAYQRKVNAIATVFATAPGGSDINNPNSLWAQVAAARTPDGKMLGNHPDWIKLMTYVAGEINPESTVVEDGKQAGMGLNAELASLQALRKTDPKKYWSDPVQTRELELITAQQKIQARQRA